MRLHGTHLLVHGRHVPHIADDGPAGHHPQQVTDHAVLGAVPESISKLWVVLKKYLTNKQTLGTSKGNPPVHRWSFLQYLHGYWVYGGSNFKTSLFKHHDRCVVDAGSWEKTRASMRTELWESVTAQWSHWGKTQTRPEEIHYKTNVSQLPSHLPSGNINIGSFVLSFTWSFNLEATWGKKRGIYFLCKNTQRRKPSGMSIFRAEIITLYSQRSFSF